MRTLPTIDISRLKHLLVIEKHHTVKLDSAVQNAREEWQQALKEMNYIDGELSEYTIFKINAAERRYIALLNQARKEGITAWPDAEFPPVRDICEDICTNTEIKNAPAL